MDGVDDPFIRDTSIHDNVGLLGGFGLGVGGMMAEGHAPAHAPAQLDVQHYPHFMHTPHQSLQVHQLVDGDSRPVGVDGPQLRRYGGLEMQDLFHAPAAAAAAATDDAGPMHSLPYQAYYYAGGLQEYDDTAGAAPQDVATQALGPPFLGQGQGQFLGLGHGQAQGQAPCQGQGQLPLLPYGQEHGSPPMSVDDLLGSGMPASRESFSNSHSFATHNMQLMQHGGPHGLLSAQDGDGSGLASGAGWGGQPLQVRCGESSEDESGEEGE
jgi:hypothetical protein